MSTAEDVTQKRRRAQLLVPVGPSPYTPPPRGRLVRAAFDVTHGEIVGGRYRVTETIGSGGMGDVYRALDLQTGEEVALKALQRGVRDAVALRRLRREAESAIAVRHPAVCRVHHLGVERGTPFIVMERLRGETLRRRIAETGPLSAEDALDVMSQLLDGLSATHEEGIVHRDVKPGNVFIVSPRGAPPKVKLIDFGLAKPLRQETPSSARFVVPRLGPSGGDGGDITTAHGMPGTLFYLAPEQVDGTPDPDARIDVYAAALTFYEMLVGRRLYDGGTFAYVVRRIVFEPPPSLRARRSDLPAWFDDVFAMALAKQRARRFVSASAFRRALAAGCETPPATVDLPSREPYRSEAPTIPDRDDSIEVDFT